MNINNTKTGRGFQSLRIFARSERLNDEFPFVVVRETVGAENVALVERLQVLDVNLACLKKQGTSLVEN